MSPLTQGGTLPLRKAVLVTGAGQESLVLSVAVRLNFSYTLCMAYDYRDLFDKAAGELRVLLHQRFEINSRISKLSSTVLALSRQLDLNSSRRRKLMDITNELGVFRPRLTDAVKDAVYYAKPKALPAAQVKELMEVRGFDFSGFPNPLASVHSTLRRLAAQGRIGAEADEGSTVYSWTGPHYGARNSLANFLSEREVRERMDAKSRARINRELALRAGIKTAP